MISPMSTETRPPEPEEPQPKDEQWNKLREIVKAAMGVGAADVSELTELVNVTRNEGLRAVINARIEQLAKPPWCQAAKLRPNLTAQLASKP
jgi:hypothetical protein